MANDLIPVFLKIFFETAYVFRFSYYEPVHWYSPDYMKMAISWIPVLLLCVFRRRCRKTNLLTCFDLFFYMSAIPAFSVYWMRSENTEAFLLLCLYAATWLCMTWVLTRDYGPVNHLLGQLDETGTEHLIRGGEDRKTQSRHITDMF